MMSKFLAFYEARKSITVVKRPWHLTLPWNMLIKSTPSHLIFIMHLILPFYFCIKIQTGLFLQVSQQNVLSIA